MSDVEKELEEAPEAPAEVAPEVPEPKAEVVEVPVKANPCRIVHYDPAQDQLADQATRRALN